jgi:hypothetical protein
MARLRIGIVCEGSTDTVIIKTACERYLQELGWQAEVFSIQPLRDNTRGERGGWTMVRDWLASNPHDVRCRRHFGIGLFANGLDAFQCDIIFVHLDSDVIWDPVFNSGRAPKTRTPSADRRLVEEVLEGWVGFSTLSDADRIRYVLGVAVQSTETWCIAMFEATTVDLERLEGRALAEEFNRVLLASESSSHNPTTAKPKKDTIRRARYVEKHATKAGLRRARLQSESFGKALTALKVAAEALAPL